MGRQGARLTAPKGAWTGLCALLATVIVACSGAGTTATRHPRAATGVQKGGSVVLAVNGSLTGFNWHVTTAASQVLNSLMTQVWPSAFDQAADGGLVLDRDLLESAELTSTSPQTVVYRINPKAVWSDGVPIDASDFVYLSRTAYSRGAKDVDGTEIQSTDAGPADAIQSVTGSDHDKTVTVVFAHPYPDWQSLFGLLVPAHVAMKVGWNHGFDKFDPSVVLSGGPFRIASYRPDQDLTLVRNERYWGTAANLDSLVVRFLPDPAQVASAMQNHEVDVAAAFGSSVDLVNELRAVPSVTTAVSSQDRFTRIVFNLHTASLAVAEVRRAIALALDRPGIVARTIAPLDRSKARVTDSRLFAPTEAGYTDTSQGRYEHADVPAARRLLESAGFRPGSDGIYARGDMRLSFRLLAGPVPPVAELVQAEERAAGIDIRIDSGPPVLTRAKKGDFDLWATEAPTWTGQKATNATYYTTGGGLNTGKYSNTTVDRLFAQANGELDEGRRTELYNRIDAILWDDLPTVPLYQSLGVIAYRSDLADVALSPGGDFFVSGRAWGRRGH